MEKIETPGFQKPRIPQDEYTAELYKEYGLGERPSLKEIERIATGLLSNTRTIIAGAKLVLGRRVDGSSEKEQEVLRLIMAPGLSGRDCFGLLLMQKVREEMEAQQKMRAVVSEKKFRLQEIKDILRGCLWAKSS